MRKVTLSRSRIVELVDIYEQCSMVTPDAGEDFDKVQRFKWRVGRNFRTCHGLAKQFHAEAEALAGKVEHPQTDAYVLKREGIVAEFMAKEENGEPKRDENGRPFIPKLRTDEFKAAIDSLKARYPGMAAEEAAIDKAIGDYYASTVDVELFTVDGKDVPVKINGAYLTHLEDMVDNIAK